MTPRAARDLDAIAEWTLANWGVMRMEEYLLARNARFRWLAENPLAGRERGDIAKGYRSFPEGRHLVSYIDQGDFSAVIGVPYQTMDAAGLFI